MHSISPADELAAIRAEIARLRAREATLRTAILARPDRLLIGRWTQIVVEPRVIRSLDPALLPEDIRSDPRFHRDRSLNVLRTLPLPLAPATRPGWPIRCQTGARPGLPLMAAGPH